MLKKKMILSVVSILCVCLLAGGYFVGRSIWEKANAPAFEIRPDVPDAPDRELIDPSEKVLASDEWTVLASRIGPPCLELYAWMSKHPKVPDVGIIEGKIVYEEEWEHPLFSDEETNEAMHEKYGVEKTKTNPLFTIDLQEVWYGDVPESHGQVLVAMGNTISRPEVGEHVVLFVVIGEERCTPLDLEHGIFTVNDDGTLYSFSNEEALYQYDGQPVQNLVDDFYRILDETEATPYFNSSGYIDE